MLLPWQRTPLRALIMRFGRACVRASAVRQADPIRSCVCERVCVHVCTIPKRIFAKPTKHTHAPPHTVGIANIICGTQQPEGAAGKGSGTHMHTVKLVFRSARSPPHPIRQLANWCVAPLNRKPATTHACTHAFANSDLRPGPRRLRAQQTHTHIPGDQPFA